MSLFLSVIQNPQSEIAGSPKWQMFFLFFAGLLILFEMIRGWRLGLMRQVMRVVAVVAAYAAGYFAGDLLVPLLRSILKMPDIVVSVPARIILAVIVYGIIASLGTILFKRTAQQGAGVFRLVYGLSGALIGFGFGVFFVWLLLVGIRSAGSIADAQVQAQSSLPQRVSPKPNLDADSLMRLVARLKNSLELGTVGSVVKRTDVMPTGELQTLSEMGTVLANPETASKFLNSPGARELSDHPRIVALRNDPEITEMITQGRIVELLRDQRVLDAMNDPTLMERVKQFDLKKALEHAGKKN
jgi:Colicin V production protein